MKMADGEALGGQQAMARFWTGASFAFAAVVWAIGLTHHVPREQDLVSYLSESRLESEDRIHSVRIALNYVQAADGDRLLRKMLQSADPELSMVGMHVATEIGACNLVPVARDAVAGLSTSGDGASGIEGGVAKGNHRDRDLWGQRLSTRLKALEGGCNGR